MNSSPSSNIIYLSSPLNDLCDKNLNNENAQHIEVTYNNKISNEPSSPQIRPEPAKLFLKNPVPNQKGYSTISLGKFKGFYDTRHLRCYKNECHCFSRGLNNCIHCKYLPYISSPLRNSIFPKKRERYKRLKKDASLQKNKEDIKKKINSELNHLISILVEFKDNNSNCNNKKGNTIDKPNVETFTNEEVNNENENFNDYHSKYSLFNHENLSKAYNSFSNKFKSMATNSSVLSTPSNSRISSSSSSDSNLSTYSSSSSTLS